MRGIDFRVARTQVRIAEVLGLLGFEPVRVVARQARGPCPLHRSRSRTSRVFAVQLDKNLYHCFRCGAGGNALDLWAAWTGQDLHVAVMDLYQRLGRAVPWLPAASWRTVRQVTIKEQSTMPDP